MNAEDVASGILEQEAKERRALQILLDRYLGKSGHILVQKTEMGGTEAFLGSVSLEWFASRVRFASELPLFEKRIDPTTRQIILDRETIEEIRQRPLDWSRQSPLAQYLAARNNHKFPPVLVVLTRPWVDSPDADEWTTDGRATMSAAHFIPLSSDGIVGLLDLTEDVQVFALDGQHRLMGVKGLMQLIQTGTLERRTKEGKPIKDGVLTKQQLVDTYGLDSTKLQALGAERIGIEFLSAVTPGEVREEARRRVRSIFVHVNRMAVQLTKGQLAALDEDDGFAIIGRRAAIAHPLLMPKQGRDPRVEWEKPTLTKRSTALTTLQTLREMAFHYIGTIPPYDHWRPKETGLIPLRPDDNQLDSGHQELSVLWDHIAELPSIKQIEQGASVLDFRPFTHEKKPGVAHLLFRPVGQIVLARAAGALRFVEHLDLDLIFAKLAKLDDQGGFRIDSRSSYWYGIMYDPMKRRMLDSGRDLATELLQYLINGFPDPARRNKLRGDLCTQRTIEDITYAFSGDEVTSDAFELPPIL